jgi:hypothetical protein
MATVDFVVVGFPKCGTSATTALLEAFPEVNICRMNGTLESPFYLKPSSLELLKRQCHPEDGLLNGHKYSAYMYSPSAVRRIKVDNPHALFIVCVRDPLRSVISWWQMHRNMAVKGEPASHFVNKDMRTRYFYIRSSLDDYYQDFARRRMGYTRYIHRLYEIASRGVRKSRIIVVAQEYLANHAQSVADVFASKMGINRIEIPASPRHISAAERFEQFPGSQAVLDALSYEKSSLTSLFAELARMKNVTLLV